MAGKSNRLGALERVQNLLNDQVRLKQHWDSTKQPGTLPITIALSREAGSGGEVIARAVADQLGWPVYDQELLNLIAEEKGIHPWLLEDLDEHSHSWLEEAIRSFYVPCAAQMGTYVKGLLEVLNSLSKVGHCVIVGRGATHVLPNETTLSVRVIAPRAKRIATVRHNLSMSAVEAERWVEATDRERLSFVKEYFHENAADPALYDLVLNAKRFEAKVSARMIVQAVEAMEAHAPTASAHAV